jgi:hypothetical protein
MAISDDVGVEPPRAVDGVVIHAAHTYWALGEIGPLLIVVWRGQPTEPALLEVNERIWDITQRRSGNCAFITIIERNSPAPPAPLRKLAMTGLTRPGSALSCKVAVIEGNELRNALTRAVLTGMVLLRPQVQPTKFFKNTQEMSLWVKAQLPQANELDREIVRAVEVVRNAISK